MKEMKIMKNMKSWIKMKVMKEIMKENYERLDK